MLVTDLIQRAASGNLRFDFIEASLTASNGRVLSSQKGQATAEPADRCFLYHFRPRGGLKEDWLCDGGYLDPAVQATGEVAFTISAVERNSSSWEGDATRLQLLRDSEGDVIHGRVKGWTRTDERSVNSSFVRVIVPGRFQYPAKVSYLPGRHARSATLSVDRVSVEFRDYGGYTEICALSAAQLTNDFPDHAVAALGKILARDLDWVYRERHRDRKRIITVQQSGSMGVDECEPPLADYGDFWRSYAEELKGML